jgi:dienelactone hydrolase
MAEILLFHHAHGLTAGLRALADRLAADGHTVHTPDAYAGAVFASLDDGIAHAERIGHDAVLDVAARAARAHPRADVVMGFSMGTMQAQYLAQHVSRIRACLLMGGAVPPEMLGRTWRPHVPLQVHVADPDDWCESQELEAVERAVPHAEVYRYRDKGHMFADPSVRDYDADAADVFEERLDDWLERLDAGHGAPARAAV